MSATIPTVHLHIGHEKRTTGSGGTRTHIHPVTGEALAEVPLAGPAEVAAAVAKAEAAREGWRRTNPEERGRILTRLADLLTRTEVQASLTRAVDLLLNEAEAALREEGVKAGAKAGVRHLLDGIDLAQLARELVFSFFME